MIEHTIDSPAQPVKYVWLVSREYDGLAGAGGVKDVCRQLAESLAQHAGCRVRVVLPRYGFIDPEAEGFTLFGLPGRALDAGGRQLCPETRLEEFNIEMHYDDKERRETVSFWHQERKGVDIYLVEAARFREKLDVYTYTKQEEERSAWQVRGTGHFDYFAVNVLLQKAALDLILILHEQPDIIHCQDGHTAILPTMARELPGYCHFFRQTGLVVTIHNAGFGYHQEVSDLAFATAITALPSRIIKQSLLGHDFDPFIAAAGYAVLNTVSENYASELQETIEDNRTGWLGHLLLRRGIHLAGITNGIAVEDYNPERGKGLAAAFNPEAGDLEGKARCKEALLAECAINAPTQDNVKRYGHLEAQNGLPLFTFIGRLTEQKGVDLFIQAVEALAEKDQGFQVLALGSGQESFEDELKQLAIVSSLKGRICFLCGYNENLATRIYAGGDFFLIPSQYEPCGLTDYIAQLFGNIPLVRNVGGLIKVIDGETGLYCREHSGEVLLAAMEEAMEIYRHDRDRLRAMQSRAVRHIREHHTWENVMHDYLQLYLRAMKMACAKP